MKALVLHQIGQLYLENIILPEPSVEETILKISYCALCRTDAKIWQKGHRDLVLPRILGHEIVGIDQVSKRKMIVWPGDACGTCDFCKKGQENLCPSIRIIGFNRNGGLAEEMIVPNRSLVPLPAGLPSRLACIAEPLACCINSIQQTGLQSGHRLLIFGAGPLGLLMALAARSLRYQVFIVDKNPLRITQNQAYLDKLNVISDIPPTQNYFDAAVNACSVTETLQTGLSALKSGGTFCLFSGLPQENIGTDLINEIHYRQLRLAGAYGCTREQLQQALEIIVEHQQEIDLLIAKEIGLDEVQDHLPGIADGQSLKIIVRI